MVKKMKKKKIKKNYIKELQQHQNERNFHFVESMRTFKRFHKWISFSHSKMNSTSWISSVQFTSIAMNAGNFHFRQKIYFKFIKSIIHFALFGKFFDFVIRTNQLKQNWYEIRVMWYRLLQQSIYSMNMIDVIESETQNRSAVYSTWNVH